MSDSNRTAKATATRQRKREEARDALFTIVSTSPEPKLDWIYCYDVEQSLDFVRKTFLEDDRFVDLMRAGKIAVIARTLNLPKWAQRLTREEQDRLPTVDGDRRLTLDVFPLVQTGDPAFDADLLQVQENQLAYARRLSPRRAKHLITEFAMIFGRINDVYGKILAEHAKLVADNGTFRALLTQKDSELARVKRALAHAQAKNDRLETEGSSPFPSTSEMEDRAH